MINKKTVQQVEKQSLSSSLLNTFLNRWLRWFIQILALLFFPESFAVSLFAIKRIVRAVAAGKTDSLTDPLMILAATIPAVILFGRYYCGYLCGFGTIQDLLYAFPGQWIRKSRKQKVQKKKSEIRQEDRLSYLKYMVLLSILILAFCNQLPDASFSPWTAFAALIDIRHWDIRNLMTLGGVLLLLIFLVSMIVYRPFCRYLCPMGALYSLCSLLSADHRNRPNRGKLCSGHCSVCQIQCKNKRTNYIGLIFTIGLFLLVNLFLVDLVRSADISEISQIEHEGTGNYLDGVYEGSAEGFRGKTRVSVTVEQGYIAGITVEDYEDDRSYMESVLSELLPAILQTQSTEVDMVSGATYSSRGLLQAIDKAMLCAVLTEDGQTPEIEEPTAYMNFSEVPDGTYEGTAVGFRGDLTLQVTVEAGAVTNIRMISYYDNEEYLFHACASILPDIVAEQTLNVDVVTGATYSRNGLVKAVANALDIDEEAYELADARPRADKNKEGHHITQKFVESDEQYQELIEKYRDLQFDVNGIRIK